MTLPGALLREMRRRAGLSQRELARRAGTSQPAVARYERGAATPGWQTLGRLAAACGHRTRLDAVPLPDPDDVELVKALLQLSPQERLDSLRRYAALREVLTEG